MSRKMNIYYSVLVGATAGLLAWFILSAISLSGFDEGNVWIRVLVKGAIVGILVGGALGAVEGLLDRSSRKATVGSGAGIGFGLVGGAIGLAIGEGFSQLVGGGIAGRSFGWAAFGLAVGLSEGLVARSPRKTSYGAVGGAIGGFIGGIFLETVSGADVEPWTVGIGLVVLGALIGFLIASVEELLTDAKVRVLAGLLEGREFNLTKAVTTLGADDRCDIGLPGDSAIPSWAAEVRRGSGGYTLVPSEAGIAVNRSPISGARLLQSQDRLQVGSTVLVFTERKNRSIWTTGLPERLRKVVSSLLVASLVIGAIAVFATRAEAQAGADLRVSKIDGGSDFPQIKIFASVTDAAGKPVQLTDRDFGVWEDGKRVSVKLSSVGDDEIPVTTVLVIDRSGSMIPGPRSREDKLTPAKVAAKSFIDLMRPIDSAAVVTFNESVEVVADITQDKQVLRNAVNRIQGGGNTSLFAAAGESLELLLKAQSGKQAILLLTDGIATDVDRDVPRLVESAIDRVVDAANASGSQIYTIGLGSRSSVDVEVLEKLADRTNGRSFLSASAAELSDLYSLISAQITGEYILTYESPNPAQDGNDRKVRIEVNAGGTRLEANRSYLPPCCVLYTPSLRDWDTADWALLGVLLVAFASLAAPRGVPALIGRLETASDTAAASPSAPAASVPPTLAPPPPSSSPTTVAPAPSAMSAQLNYRLEFSDGDLPLVIGSGGGVDLLLKDATVSAAHAQILRQQGRYVVRDLSSKSGTFLNYSGASGRERRVDGQNALQNGSVVRFGDAATVVFEDVPSPSLVMTVPVTSLPWTIGSDLDNDLVLGGAEVLGHHAQIEMLSGRPALRPLGASETRVSFTGDPQKETIVRDVNALKNGSTIRIGSHILTFDDGSGSGGT